jgi:hypothetical protein
MNATAAVSPTLTFNWDDDTSSLPNYFKTLFK